MSQLRKLARAVQRHEAFEAQKKFETEHAEIAAERKRLFDRVKFHAESLGEKDLVKFWEYLKQKRRGYDPKHDGVSELMQLVDDWRALDELEAEARAATKH